MVDRRVRCACGRDGCTGAVWFSDGALYFTNDVLNAEGTISEVSVYMDANALVALIQAARQELLARAT